MYGGRDNILFVRWLFNSYTRNNNLDYNNFGLTIEQLYIGCHPLDGSLDTMYAEDFCATAEMPTTGIYGGFLRKSLNL